MASFIVAAYKTPLAAAVFVAEATEGHTFIIPALIGAAVAYALSGDASISGDQRLHEDNRSAELAMHSEEELQAPLAVSCEADL